MKRFKVPVELPLALGCLVVVTLCVDLLIALQPDALSPLRDSLQRWVDLGAGWPALFAASVAVVASTTAAAILARFVRGVQTDPYVWTAPWVLGALAWVMGTIPVRLPLPMSTAEFAVLSALLLVGGGAVFRPRSLLRSAAGGLLMCTPFVLLIVGYDQATAPFAFDGQAQWLGFTLAFAALVTLILSFTTHRLHSDNEAQREQERQADQLRVQVIELLERCNASEARAMAAERRLASLGRL